MGRRPLYPWATSEVPRGWLCVAKVCASHRPMGLLTETYRFDPRLNKEDWDGPSQRGKGCKLVLLVEGRTCQRWCSAYWGDWAVECKVANPCASLAHLLEVPGPQFVDGSLELVETGHWVSRPWQPGENPCNELDCDQPLCVPSDLEEPWLLPKGTMWQKGDDWNEHGLTAMCFLAHPHLDCIIPEPLYHHGKKKEPPKRFALTS